ncbi:hypothetical protein [Desulfitobacterium hafniense]|uniref:Uncharacterized protein n=3 Tax=Desulfitobacterium hafniense TaxID=49338 RepID=A0A0W1JG43_DESHA|nr:hypothetical protein [Desulfitobacterium hafniense]ACL20382.1 hypothetical protein Dhaf_2352 [Desulfitobacterium hafniense DCB-2]EHL05513.1 hypothetical protein HMPREF0322_03733 [Desulfitobacterium hafniense DP7]KTE90580.1 hypothetical protein AT727_08290 [Desulfitobacterium hafniense]
MNRRAGTGQAQQEEGPAEAMLTAAVEPSRQSRVQEWIWTFPQSISPARIRSRVYESTPGFLGFSGFAERGASC